VDGQIRCRYLVGAGGTRCPVYRSLFRQSLPRARALQAVTLEHELPYDWRDGDCHLWFFQGGLPGYAWYVPKAEGYVNVGIGAMAAQLKARGDDIQGHWQAFARRLDRLGLVDAGRLSPDGYSYWLRAENGPSRVGNAFVVGDAAGLATRDLCEGIGPAVRSGQRAAEAIAGRRDFGLEDVRAHSLGGLPARWLDGRFTRAAA
jgi:flavin-dependent dehydrogenase